LNFDCTKEEAIPLLNKKNIDCFLNYLLPKKLIAYWELLYLFLIQFIFNLFKNKASKVFLSKNKYLYLANILK